jgi:hypothetical protein
MLKVIGLSFATLLLVAPIWVGAWWIIIPEDIRYPGTIIHFKPTGEPPFLKIESGFDAR